MAQPPKPATTLEIPGSGKGDRTVGRPGGRPVSPLPPWRHRGDAALPRQSSPEREAPSKFPRVFQLFRPQHGGLVSTTYRIAENEDQPLFAVTVHRKLGLFERPSLELHGGPDKKDPVLASVRHNDEKSHAGFGVEMPLPASEARRRAAEGAETSEVIHVRRHVGSGMSEGEGEGGKSYRFSIKISKRWGRPQEIFEWRRGEVEAWDTWKLIRVGADFQPTTHSMTSSRHSAEDDWSDDEEVEEEIVAVWTIDESSGSRKTGKFEFVNSATLGRLGERFATLAIMTALGIWDDRSREGA